MHDLSYIQYTNNNHHPYTHRHGTTVLSDSMYYCSQQFDINYYILMCMHVHCSIMCTHKHGWRMGQAFNTETATSFSLVAFHDLIFECLQEDCTIAVQCPSRDWRPSLAALMHTYLYHTTPHHTTPHHTTPHHTTPHHTTPHHTTPHHTTPHHTTYFYCTCYRCMSLY